MSEHPHVLVESVDQLAELVQPVLAGEVDRLAFDTETTPVVDGRFTPYGTETRIAGFSLSWRGGRDLYVPIRHVPYDWRRRVDLIQKDAKNDGAGWVRRLLEVERVLPMDAGPGWQDGADPNVPLGPALELLEQVLWAPALRRVYAHNWGFDGPMLDVEGIPVPFDIAEDTVALSTFTDPRQVDAWDEDRSEWVHGGHSLKHLGERWLGIPADAQALLAQAQKALGKGSQKLMDYSMLPLRTAIAPYGAMDTHLTLLLAEQCEAREAFQDPKVRQLIDEHREERREVLLMMKRGMPVDEVEAGRRCELKEAERTQILERLEGLSGGRAVPVTNYQQLSVFLYEEMGLPKYRRKDDTREATLKRVRVMCVEANRMEDAKLVDGILDFRKVEKELTSFYRPLSQGEDGVVHTVLRPLQARTTRYSSEKPNVQQMPKPKKAKDPAVKRANQLACVRHLFKPPDGYGFLPCDFSAQEMRVASHFTIAIPKSFAYRFVWGCTLAKRGDCKGRAPHGDKNDRSNCWKTKHAGWRENYSVRPDRMGLAEGFLKQGTAFDPHQRQVELCEERGVDVDRDQAKTGNFAILYGAGSYKLGETLDCTTPTAQQLIDLFWYTAYPELGRVRLFIEERLRRTGTASRFSHQDCIRTLHGAPIYLESAYKGLNYVIQRSCREILLKATLGVRDVLAKHQVGDAYQLRLPVHDELVLMVAKDSLDQAVVQDVAAAMVHAGAASKVPMVVEPAWAEESWAVKESLGPEWGADGVAMGLGVDLEEL